MAATAARKLFKLCHRLGHDFLQPLVVFSDLSSSGWRQTASEISDRSGTGSPESQRAAKHRITKCRATLSVVVAQDHLAVAGERHRFDRERGFLPHLADHGLGQRFAGLYHSARQGIDAGRETGGAPDDQHLAVADHGGADRQETAGRDRRGDRSSRHGPVACAVPVSEAARRPIACADAMPSPPRRKRCAGCSAIRKCRTSRRATTWRRPSRSRSCGWSRASGNSRWCAGV